MSIKKYLSICLVFLLVVSVFGSLGGYSDTIKEEGSSGLEHEGILNSKEDPKMYVLVNSTVHEPLEDELARYKEDVEDMEDLEVEIIENTYTDATEIRDLFQEGYENDGLKGVFLVGNLPYAEFEISDHPGEADGYVRFPIDHYYTDLDGVWEDTNNSGVFDEHLPGDGDLDPEIWLGRISMKTDWEDEIELYKNYFEKVHQYRRGDLSVEDRSLLYIDDDWVPWTEEYKQGLLNLYDDDNITVINETEETTADDYGDRVQEGYEWIQIHCHANDSAERHAFRYQDGPKGSGGNFTSRDIYEDGHDSLFQNVFTCGSGDYTAPNYLCGWYALSEDKGLANVGSTQPGSMLGFENYYEPLSFGRSLGEAMQEWWTDTVEDDFESRTWFYGMTTIGDPTLSLVDEDDLERYELTVEIEGEGEVEIDPEQDDYLEGMEVDLKTVPEEGWVFEGWTGDQESSEEEIKLVMNENKSLTAHFRDVEDEYEISDWEDLHDMRNDLDGYYVLMDNLDEDTDGYTEFVDTEEGWDPIEHFAGTFDGNGFEIRDLYIDGGDDVGLFGTIEEGSEVSNVGIVDAEVNGENNVGGLVGAKSGTVENSYSTGDVSGETSVGGLIGFNGWGPLKNSYATGDVSGEGNNVGGLVGYNRGGTIFSSNATGEVSGENSVGGLVGRAERGTVENSYATGDISGENSVGGLIGSNHDTIENSYATGDVSGEEERIGGLIGFNQGFVLRSYATGEVTGNIEVGAFAGSNGDQDIVSSYASGDVEGNTSIGGFVGQNFGTETYIENSYSVGEVIGGEKVGGFVGENFAEATVKNSYSVGEVTGEENVGGFVGENFLDATAENSFWDVEASGIDESDDGTGLTTDEMRDVATYTDMETEGLDEPWDFVGDPNDDEGDDDTWDIDGEINNGYPFLSWSVSELTIDVVGEGDVDIDPVRYKYIKGTTVDLTADPYEDWYFSEWTGDETSTDTTISITMDDDKDITAHFKEVPEEYDLKFVVEDEEGEPIKRAEIAVNGESLETDQQGEAVFEDMEPDTYGYVVNHEEYETEEGEIEIVDQNETITVTMEVDAEDIPGFTSMILVLGMIIAVAIYQKKEQ